MERNRDRESLIEQYEELQNKSYSLQLQTLHQSAIDVMMEAKRLAKRNRLLTEYVYACFVIANDLQVLWYNPEIGIDNALEMIAYLEDPDKARRFQADYDEDQYAYLVHQFLTCGYDNLAVHTAMRLGYNSPTVAGAVDDGIQVCRRTGNLEAINGFREFAIYVYQASGDYEMAEVYARYNTCLPDGTLSEKRKFEGLELLICLSMQQGKLQAAFEYLDEIHPVVDTYHDPEFARKTLLLRAERLFWLAGKEDEFADYLTAHGYKGMPSLPPREENGKVAWELTLTNAVKLARQDRFVEAADVLRDFDQFLTARGVLNRWFDIRLARVACLLMAQAAGQAFDDNVDRLKRELRDQANEAQHWSAISSLDAMEEGELPLNPLAIGFPIDIGPYARPGTAVSHACLKQNSPFDVYVCRRISTSDPSHGTASEDDSALLKAAYNRISRINNVLESRCRYDYCIEQSIQEGEDVSNMTFPGQAELDALEAEALAAALEVTLESYPNLTPDELHATARPLFLATNINTPEIIKKVWSWIASFEVVFKDFPRYMMTRAVLAHQLCKYAIEQSLDPDSLGLPSEETTMNMIAKAHKMAPQNIPVALAGGCIYNDNGHTREALYYYSRACQLERENDSATNELTMLYDKEDRPKDVLAVIDLYCRAGGRHPVILRRALQVCIANDMPQMFLLYYPEFFRTMRIDEIVESWRIQVFLTLSLFQEAITALDQLEQFVRSVAVDRLLVRAICLANLGQKWEEPFEEALAMIHKKDFAHCKFDPHYDLCGAVWDLVAKTLPESDERRLSYIRFLYEHGAIPHNFFPNPVPYEQENENDEEGMLLWRVILRQTLDPSLPAFQLWWPMRDDVNNYVTMWYVVANDEDEAERLALAEQKKCYAAGHCIVEQIEACEHVSKSDPCVVVFGGRQEI